jgi:hypothetical protein
VSSPLLAADCRRRGRGCVDGHHGNDRLGHCFPAAGPAKWERTLDLNLRANCICPGLVDTPALRRARARMTPAERAGLPPVLTPADIADAAMDLLADDTLAGRTVVCRGGEPRRLLPLVDWQTA